MSIVATNPIQYEGNSSVKSFEFVVTRSGDTSGGASFDWTATGSGANPANLDSYNASYNDPNSDRFTSAIPTGTVRFAAGQTSATVWVTIQGDTTVEPDEGFSVTLSNAGGSTIGVATAYGTILNDDGIPPDTTAPTATTFSPADEATGVAISSNILVTFSEVVQRGTGSIVLKTAAGGIVATYDAATSANLSIEVNPVIAIYPNPPATSTLTINPTADLSAGTIYKVEFAAGSVKDLAGNNYAGITTYNFTTAATTSLPSGQTTAKVYLGLNDNFTISNSGTTLYGNTGIDVVTLTTAATGVVLDQNVDRINFANTAASYTFKQTGNKINVYDTTGTTLLTSLPVQGDADGTVLSFSNGSASAKLSAGVMTLGGASISGVSSGAVSPTLTSNPATPTELSKAKVYLGQSDNFTLNSSGTTLYGNTGIDKVTLANGVRSTVLDQNVDEVVFLNASSSYAFKQTGNKINVYDATGVTLLTSLPVQGDADGTVLTFSNGSASAKLTAGVMTLGLATVSSAVATTLLPFVSTVAISGAGSSSAAGADQTFTLALGNYTHSISGFAAGDKLDFPAGNVLSVVNESFADGQVELSYASAGNHVTIRLTGLASSIDQQLIFSLDFDLLFGAGTVF